MGSPALGPANQLFLQCLIEASPEQRPGKPVIVKGTLHNAGARGVWILPWATFLDPDWPDCVSITHNGSRVEYVGPIKSHGGFTQDAYINIPAGESRSCEIDITERYGVWKSGDYDLSFHMSVIGDFEGILGTLPNRLPINSVTVDSAKIRFRMGGAKPPTFRGMDGGTEADFLAAYRWAYESIIAALLSAQRLGPFYSTYFEQNRGDGSKERHNTVLGSLKAMVDWLSTKSILVRSAPGGGACTGDVLGCTQRSTRGPIELCPKAFNNDHLRLAYLASAEWGRAFVLVHEISHAAGGTEDKGYDESQCKEFARRDPGSAIANAQNFAYFALACYPSAPPGVRADNGIWSERAVSRGGGRAEHGPAAIEVAPNVVMVAYREPEPPKLNPEMSDVGGQLCYKTLHLANGSEDWKNATPFQPLVRFTRPRELRSVATPALARWDGNTYCAYVDAGLGLLSVCARDRDWQELKWVGTRSETEPELISGHPDRSEKHLSPALASYTGGKSKGLYCVYVSSDGALQCAAKFDGGSISGRGLGPWTPVSFDKSRTSTSAPTLAVFKGQLKCAYRDAQKSRYVVLTYQPAPGPAWNLDNKPGTWVEDDSFPDLETSTMALVEWETADGPALVALGSVIPITGDASDNHLRYSVLTRDGKWSKEVITEEHTSYGVPALVAVGRVLYALLTGKDGNIESIRARS